MCASSVSRQAVCSIVHVSGIGDKIEKRNFEKVTAANTHLDQLQPRTVAEVAAGVMFIFSKIISVQLLSNWEEALANMHVTRDLTTTQTYCMFWDPWPNPESLIESRRLFFVFPADVSFRTHWRGQRSKTSAWKRARFCTSVCVFFPLSTASLPSQNDPRSESWNFGGGQHHPKTASSADVVQATTVQGCWQEKLSINH